MDNAFNERIILFKFHFNVSVRLYNIYEVIECGKCFRSSPLYGGGNNKRGKSKPRRCNDKKLCDGLDISIADFFDTEAFRNLEQEIRQGIKNSRHAKELTRRLFFIFSIHDF